MKLKRVVYELYDVDLISLHDHPEWHEIDGEIYLEFESGKRQYFSWGSDPVQYSIGVKDCRFNVKNPDHTIDASEWDMWQGLIDSEIELISHCESRQILELKGQGVSIYLSSQQQGSWLSDVMHVSTKLPKLCS